MGDKQREAQLAGRLRSIENALNSGEPDAIKHFGDQLSQRNFDPNTPVTELSLYQKAVMVDARQGTNYAGQVASLYKLAVEGFVPPAIHTPLAAATQVNMPVTPTRSIDTAVDETIERLPFDKKPFTSLFRTAETHRLDEQYGIARMTGQVLTAPLGNGVTEIDVSNIMPIFEKIANLQRYFAGVRVEELEKISKGYSLEIHVREGFVARRTFIDNGKKVEIAVPVRFY